MLSLNSFISMLGMLAGSGSVVFIEFLLGYYVCGVLAGYGVWQNANVESLLGYYVFGVCLLAMESDRMPEH